MTDTPKTPAEIQDVLQAFAECIGEWTVSEDPDEQGAARNCGQILSYLRSLEAENAAMRKVIEYIDIIATEDEADEDKQCLAIIKAETQKILSSPLR